MNLEHYTRESGPLAVGFGAGVDSMAMLVGFMQRGIRPDAIVFSDTRGEKSPTYFYIDLILRPWLRKVGFPDLVVVCRADFPNHTRTGDESLEAECLRLGTLPSRAYGYGTCADKWKIDPFKWWVRERWDIGAERWRLGKKDAWQNGWKIVRAIGYEYGEEHRVGKQQDPGFDKWFPLIEWKWDREACKQAILGERLPLPPKSACYFCPSSRKEEILQLRRDEPKLFDRAVAIERRAMGTGRWGNMKGLGRRFSWEELVAMSEAERAEQPEQPVESCTICVDGNDDPEDDAQRFKAPEVAQ